MKATIIKDFIDLISDEGYELYNILTNERSNRISIPNNSQYNTNVWTEVDIILNDNYNTNLHLEYPDTIGTNYRFLQLDNLPGIRRLEPISNRGLKGMKKYTMNDKLIWSIETKYWFEDNPILEDGLVKIIRIYNTDNNVCDIWTNEVMLSIDDKESIKKDQRERIMTYFKSQQSDLFNLLYIYFSEYINEYLSIGNKQLLIDVITDASINLVDNAIFRAYLIIKKGVTNLTTAISNGDADFIPVDKFGNVIGGAGVVLNFSNITTGLGYTPANIAGDTFTGDIFATNLSGTNTGLSGTSGTSPNITSGTNPPSGGNNGDIYLQYI